MNETLPYSSQIIEPDVIRYSFNTLGWYLVAGVIVLTLIIYGFIRWRKYVKNAYRREALKHINTIIQNESKEAFFEINRQLKITCIQLFGRREVASLHGEAWFTFLLSKIKNGSPHDEYDTTVFTQAIYNPKANREAENFNAFALFWIQNHHA